MRVSVGDLPTAQARNPAFVALMSIVGDLSGSTGSAAIALNIEM